MKTLHPLLAAALVAALPAAPAAAQTGSLGVCGDPTAPVSDVAFHCRRALEKERLSDDQRAAVSLNLGYALTALGQPDLAVDAFDEAEGLAPRRVDVYLGRAQAWEARGDRAAAAKDWDRALDLAPRSVDVRLGRGAFFLRGVRPDLALTEFSAALSLDPESPDALFNRGLTYLVVERMSEAEADFTRLIRSHPDDAGAHYHRARARTGRDDRGALADFERASALAPEWSAPWFLAGRLLDRLGRTAEADAKLRRAFELGHQDPWLLERIRRMGG